MPVVLSSSFFLHILRKLCFYHHRDGYFLSPCLYFPQLRKKTHPLRRCEPAGTCQLIIEPLPSAETNSSLIMTRLRQFYQIRHVVDRNHGNRNQLLWGIINAKLFSPACKCSQTFSPRGRARCVCVCRALVRRSFSLLISYLLIYF